MLFDVLQVQNDCMPKVKEALAAHIAKNNTVPIVTGFLGKAATSGKCSISTMYIFPSMHCKLCMPRPE